jgi:hypothetical protein
MKLRRLVAVTAFAMAFPVLAQTPQDKIPVKAPDQLPIKPEVALRPLVIGKRTFPPAPAKTGCFKHTPGSTAWTETACLTQAEKAHLSHPDSIGTLTQQPGTSPVVTPINGELEVNFVAMGGVTDSTQGPGMFSLQLNTNGFTGNGDKPGDTNWVQFVYQQYPPSVNPNILCIWSIDLTTQNYVGTGPDCIAITIFRDAQTGDVASMVGSVANGQLQLAATIPWATNSGQSDPDAFLVTSPDYRNFGGSPWTSVTGGFLGTGNSSQAVLTRSCITSTPSFWFENPSSGANLNGGLFSNANTGESNNLTGSNTPVASCAANGLCGASTHGVSADWYKTDGVKSCYPNDDVAPLPNPTVAQVTEDDSTVYTAHGDHIRMCKNNALMIGVDVNDSRFLCSATMPYASELTVDKSTKGVYVYHTGLRAPLLHSVHVCPAFSVMVGWDQGKDLLLCGQIPPSGYVPVNPTVFGKDSVNESGSTQVPEPNYPKQKLHACDPKGSGGPEAMAGIDVANNVLVCRNSGSVPRLN